MKIPWQPRYWPVWIGFGLLRLLATLPFPLQMAMGRGLGRLLRRVMASRDRVARRNLELCFPELDEPQREEMLKGVWASIGCMLPELGLSWYGSDRRVRKFCSRIDVSELDRVREQGHGVVLLSAHFTHLDLGGRVICLEGPENKAGLYREHKNAAVEYLVRRGRSYVADMFSRDQTRAAIRLLRQGGVLWYSPDQDYQRGESLFAPFFGVPAHTTTSAHHLARMGKAKIMVLSIKREAGRYEVVVKPALVGLPSNDVEADCLAINLAMESIIRECPKQYFWVHRRFKTRPPGEDPIY
jgi:KDO2-lipid IV(A) lauroyltransferase